jgi:hypothetical protein
MHPEYSDQYTDEEEFDAMPDEAKDHMWAAFAHSAGLGPHPGKYKGPPIDGSTDDTSSKPVPARKPRPVVRNSEGKVSRHGRKRT